MKCAFCGRDYLVGWDHPKFDPRGPRHKPGERIGRGCPGTPHWKCPKCGTYNGNPDQICRKCREPKPAKEIVA